MCWAVVCERWWAAGRRRGRWQRPVSGYLVIAGRLGDWRLDWRLQASCKKGQMGRAGAQSKYLELNECPLSRKMPGSWFVLPPSP
ncbi:hypothetical protein O3P69_017530 [Scylla paramamosain]|uniref:Secreted protein n=1 Tax=Scylla paramamosain TaxID=85552 RepID=A0AAW0TXG9_SCYPA